MSGGDEATGTSETAWHAESELLALDHVARAVLFTEARTSTFDGTGIDAEFFNDGGPTKTIPT